MRWYYHSFNQQLAYKVVFTIIPRLPKFVHPPIAFITALIFFVLLKRERRAILRNQEYIGIPNRFKRWWTAYKVFYSFCDFIVSYCYVPNANKDELLSMLSGYDWGKEKVESCLDKGKGLIMWTAHLGNWEYGARLLGLSGAKLNAARVVERTNAAEIALRNLMANDTLKIIELNQNYFASVELLNALRNNEIVGIQGDRIYQDYTGTTTFFGHDTTFPMGPFLLSYISGAPIIPACFIRVKWLKYRLVSADPIIMDQEKDKEIEIQRGLETAVRFLENCVRQYPDQWMNFYEFTIK